jgi:hypothetical protein
MKAEVGDAPLKLQTGLLGPSRQQENRLKKREWDGEMNEEGE